MSKFKIDVKKYGEKIATYESDRFSLKFGVLQDVYEIYEAWKDGDVQKVIHQKNLVETAIDIVKEMFPKITDEHIRELDIVELILELGPQIASYLGEQMGMMSGKIQPKLQELQKVV